MKITLSGYGKMGKEIEKIAVQNNHSITAILDKLEDWEIYLENIVESDVIIDFSQPDVVLSNIHQAFKINIPIVVGTTGWDNWNNRLG
jgi:4-hydroxy-tetrahydrodipicolinate reductase